MSHDDAVFVSGGDLSPKSRDMLDSVLCISVSDVSGDDITKCKEELNKFKLELAKCTEEKELLTRKFQFEHSERMRIWEVGDITIRKLQSENDLLKKERAEFEKMYKCEAAEKNRLHQKVVASNVEIESCKKAIAKKTLEIKLQYEDMRGLNKRIEKQKQMETQVGKLQKKVKDLEEAQKAQAEHYKAHLTMVDIELKETLNCNSILQAKVDELTECLLEKERELDINNAIYEEVMAERDEFKNCIREQDEYNNGHIATLNQKDAEITSLQDINEGLQQKLAITEKALRDVNHKLAEQMELAEAFKTLTTDTELEYRRSHVGTKRKCVITNQDTEKENEDKYTLLLEEFNAFRDKVDERVREAARDARADLLESRQRIFKLKEKHKGRKDNLASALGIVSRAVTGKLNAEDMQNAKVLLARV